MSAAEIPPAAAPAAPPRMTRRLLAWARTRLHEVVADERVDGVNAWIHRGRQVRAISRLLPFVIVGNVLNTMATSLVAWDVISHTLLIGWSVFVVGGIVAAGQLWRSMLRGQELAAASAFSYWQVAGHSALYALLWVALPVYVFPAVGHSGQLLIAGVTAGMLCVGSFLLTPHAPAALAYAAIMTVGSVIGLGRASVTDNFNLMILLAAYSSTIVAIIWFNARVFLAGARAESEKEKQQQLVGLLLRDFEENTSDWLWEVSRQGLLRHVSARLEQSFARPAAELQRLRFVDLLESVIDREDPHGRAVLHRLRDALGRHAAFRDIELPVVVQGQRRWWSLTAKPLLDNKGQKVGWRGVGSDVTRERTARGELARLANYDTLTGLANRHLFSQQLEGLRHTADQQPRPCSLMLLDLDNFKMVNDTLGHEVGDEVLRLVARRLRERIQPGDLLARLGGDEFALLSWETTDPAVVAQRAQGLVDSMNEPCVVEDARIEMRTSVGIALAPSDGDRPQALLRSADLALYAAKGAGRNTWRFYDEQMAERARARLTMQHELRDALMRGELVLHYQPQVDTVSGAVCGFEALLRWRHPKRGLIGPADFIPLAEETGQIVALGAWAMQQACEQARQWPEHLRVAVNLSAVQFRSSEIAPMVGEVLAATGLEARRLELEITESALIEDNHSALATLQALRQYGVRVALDDFGTGYSSLAYLRTFPLDKLKIDGMFVRALDGDADAREVVRAIISLSHALRLDTTAEGVETHGQLDVLRELGCHDVQGFLLACPMAADDIPDFLASRAAIRH
ncbi:MAG: EAL domain-containing protein [Aquabacterium sp.]|nr:MAG: EAL domain-containing protein [Aquabacterium sp.]